MKMSLRDFFKKGELWSGLEETIETINNRINLLTKRAQESSSREVILIQYIKQLKSENSELKDRIQKIEERVWELKIVSNSNSESIVRDIPIKNSGSLGINKNHNRAINSDN